MQSLNESRNRRIIVIDDNEAIHTDFRKVLEGNANQSKVSASHAAFFGEECDALDGPLFEIDSAFQGEEGLEKVRQSIEKGQPYAMAFVDVRMPPGWDGIETIGHLWKVDPDLLVVICTAHNDYNWNDMARALGCMDHWQILKKPFDNIEVRQLAASLTEKWDLARIAELKLAELQQMVEQRTQEIEQARQQLLQSQKLEAIGTLAAGVAHEFNNLLQVITGYTDLSLKSLPEGDANHENLGHVLKAASKAVALTSGLLGFTRQQIMASEHLNPNKAVKGLINLLRPVLGASIELESRLDERVRDINADPIILQETLTNLCLNARDAMPSGGRIIIATQELEVEQETAHTSENIAPGRYVQISVADNGCGMSPEVQTRIFEPFYTTKEAGQGTGLGLAMVYGNIQQFGGSIDVTSSPGQGTTFDIFLPAVERSSNSENRLKDESSECPQATNVAQEASRSGGTILVVDDEPIIRKYALLLLTTAGYETLTAEDGEEAVSLFQKHADDIDLVLLDVVMPRMGGHAAFQAIRQIRPQARILVCSGFAPTSPDVEFVGKAGLPLIRKPYKPGDLLKCVNDTLTS